MVSMCHVRVDATSNFISLLTVSSLLLSHGEDEMMQTETPVLIRSCLLLMYILRWRGAQNRPSKRQH